MQRLNPEKIRALLPQLDAAELNVDVYRQVGVFVLRRALPAAVVQGWQSAWQAFYAGTLAAGRKVYTSNPVAVSETLPPELAVVCRHEKLLDIAEKLHGPDIAICVERVLVKDHHSRAAVVMHQDFPYQTGWPDKTSVFVPLDPANADNGGMIFYPGTHHYGYLGDAGEINLDIFGGWTAFCPRLEPGDVVLMHPFTWHGSGPHRHGSDRVTVQICYQPSDDPSGTELLRGQWRTEIFVGDPSPERLFRRSRVGRLREMQAEIDKKNA